MGVNEEYAIVMAVAAAVVGAFALILWVVSVRAKRFARRAGFRRKLALEVGLERDAASAQVVVFEESGERLSVKVPRSVLTDLFRLADHHGVAEAAEVLRRLAREQREIGAAAPVEGWAQLAKGLIQERSRAHLEAGV